ncbi:MAG: PepSY domain-containing protein [Lachnospiraceae bacterium]
MKRKMICVMSVMMIVLLAAGCGKSDGTSGGSPTRTDAVGMETTAPGAGMTENGNAAGMTESTTGTEAAASKTATETGNSVTDARISENEAKEIALKDAGVSEKDISGIRIKLEKDDGIWQYEVDFYAGDKEYDYDIDADIGKILSKDMEIDNDFRKSGAEQSAGISLSEEEAVKLVLEKVPQASKDNIRIHLDYEDGKPVYEGSIVYKGVEYDFEIDAATGTILEWEQER